MELEHPYCFGPFLVDPTNRLLLRDGIKVALHGKAFDTLLLLVRNPDRLIKKDELLRELWPGRLVEENNLSQCISTVRKALGDTTQAHAYIVTVPGWGYRFAPPVSKSSENLPGRVAPMQVQPEQAVRGGFRVKALALSFIVVLLLVGLLASRFGTTIFGQNPLKAATSARRSVAILGFENLSGKKEDAWLSIAIGEMLHTELSAGEHVRVISQKDVAQAQAEFSLANRGVAAKEAPTNVASRLGSDLILSGSYSIVGDDSSKQVRFDLRLQDTHSGETVAEFAEAGAQTRLFGLVAQAGGRLRQRLGISELSPTETLAVRAAMPANAAAAKYYSEGLARLRNFDAIGARDLLQKATTNDPSYSLAHAALADAWTWLGYDHKARDEAEKAFQLSGGLSHQDQLTVEGEYRTITRDWGKAVQVYKTLFSLFPDDVEYGLKLALAQTSTSKAADALATLNSLRSLPPPAGNDPRINFEEYDAWRSVGDFKRMENALTATARAARNTGALLLVARARTRLCWVRRALGEPRQAVEDCQEAKQIYVAAGDRRGEAEVLRLLGDVIAQSDAPSAMRNYKEALAIEQQIGHRSGEACVVNQLAAQYASQGQHVAAKSSYERAVALFQQIDDKTNATGGMVNIGVELVALGQTDQAIEAYRDTLESAAAIGNKYIEALAEYNLGSVLELHGDLQEAQKSYQNALSTFVELGNKQYDMNAMESLIKIATAQGDFKGAHKFYEQALGMRPASQHDVSAAEREVALAELSLEEGMAPANVETSLRQVAQMFHDAGQTNDEALSRTLLARSLLAKGRSDDALQAMKVATEVSTKADQDVRLLVKVRQARTRFALDRHDAAAVAELTEAIAEAKAFHFVSVELEARLAQGELEIQSGSLARGRTHLQSVEQDASKRGFVVLARKAKAAARV